MVKPNSTPAPRPKKAATGSGTLWRDHSVNHINTLHTVPKNRPVTKALAQNGAKCGGRTSMYSNFVPMVARR